MFSSHLSYSGYVLMASPLLPTPFFRHAVAPPSRIASVIGIYLYISFYPCSSLSLLFLQPRQITAAATAVCLSTLIVTYTRRCKLWYGPLTVHSRPRSRSGRNWLAISSNVTIEIHYTGRMEFCSRIYFSGNDLRNKVFAISMLYVILLFRRDSAYDIRFTFVIYFDNSFANGRSPPFHDLVCPLTRFPLMHRSCGSSTVFWHSPMRNVDHYNMPPGPFCNAIYLRHPSTLLRIVATLAADRIIVVFHRERVERERGKWNPPEVDEVVQFRKDCVRRRQEAHGQRI